MTTLRLGLALLLIPSTLAAFTTTTRFGSDYVEQNAAGTWCYYPAALQPRSIDVACVGKAAEFAAAMDAHLNLTTTINYFDASLDRRGGPEWPVDTTVGKIYLCLSGRGGDGSYLTECALSRRDNTFGAYTDCKIEASQQRVTDGCYEPNLPKPVGPTPTSTSRRGSSTATGIDNVQFPGSAQTIKSSYMGAAGLFIVAILHLVAGNI
ncbi:hypothetical protein B0H34DRAFT_798532 [Crassisporium funariophilum]|nr:hypothetical protein B0H34DRAFT_798532 [Crassisporium funariophilum]